MSDTGLTCTFDPEEYATRWDEDDVEHETDDTDEDRGYFVCSNCGMVMMYGDEGRFETEPPYRPSFNHRPHCGARVATGHE